MAKKHWIYADARSAVYGTMICSACNKRIISGLFRFYDSGFALISQHKACSLNDLHWNRNDVAVKQRLAVLKDKLQQYLCFRDIWNENALDEEIESMQKAIKEMEELFSV